MPSSSWRCALGSVVTLLAICARAQAQQQAQGFATERLYLSAPGAGWFVMDALDMRGGLGGSFALTVGYARNVWHLSDGTRSVPIVSDQAVADLGAAVTYDRWRLYVNFEMPLVIKGQGGTIGDRSFSGPSVDLGSNPDTLTDARIGVDMRIVGTAASRFRLGAGAQLFVPNGNRSEYATDGTYRGMGRVLFAGDEGAVTYAGQLGIHLRPLNDTSAPGTPRGSELLFGAALGAKLPVSPSGSTAIVVGPEVFGATALRDFFGSTATALEALLSARLEGTGEEGLQLRVKLAGGAGVHQQFGAPDWRVVFSIEAFNHNAR